MSNQIVDVIALVKDELTKLLGDVGRSSESSSHPTVIGVIQTVVDQAVTKALQSSFFERAVK